MTERVVLVTGAAGGIGLATVERFARDGATIVATDLAEAPTGEAVAAATRAGGEAVAMDHDVSDPEAWRRVVDATLDRFGRLDVCVNNAGIEGPVRPWAEYPLGAFRKVLEVNVVGVFLGIQATAPVMAAAGSGSILNVASVAGLGGSPGIPAYIASKHAVLGLTKTAAMEFGPQGLRVNAVCPAPIETRMMRSLEEGMSPDDPTAVHDMIAGQNPMGRYGEPAEVADVLAWLASDAAGYVNGVALPIDGGARAR